MKKWLFPASQLPEQWQNSAFNSTPWLAIDLELTSLDVSIANILSIAWVEGQGNCISLQRNDYRVITTQADLNQSPVIHGLLAEDIAKGESVRAALQELAKFAESHVWVFHNADLDMGVLTRLFVKLGISMPKMVTVDTLRLALYLLNKQQQIPSPNAATLTSCRQRYHLPLAPAHNALDDAHATLELLFAQLNDLDPNGDEPVTSLFGTGSLKVFNPISG